ncbi:hypothetical protein N824_28230 [Sporocytophaga myxococcoides]|uniref:DinB-like domain-containing protein n=1 Tax=Sporocytophaga myxococcoides TaxID=153721 RepID=A0A098LBE4_9BACT|nr:DUF1569 domain-containing protein [Sporocytophaga myxococcoides]GAL83648.1 hypothetical protein N824_28230 [Sporocytophaga myxococcoides]
MKTIFDPATRGELIQRINLLKDSKTPMWGKMNVYQMTRHCNLWNEWVLGKKDFVYKQEFLGKLFGKMALKSNTKDDKPLSRNMPAGKSFTVKEKDGDFEAQIATWIQQIKSYENFSNNDFVHDFFGNMTREQIGIFAYKHNDHHLRQFVV